jgi:hypothetical protein
LKVLSAHHVAFKQRIGRKSCEIAKNLCQLRFDLVEYTQLPVWRLAKGAFPLAPISTLEKLSMKKTLIALAAVAVAGAASAQVTMSGSVAYGYKVTDTASGFGVDTAALNFAASEDLGGGLKVSVSMGIDNLDEPASGTSTAKANGAAMALTGGFGSLSMSTKIGGDAVALDTLMSLGNGTAGTVVGYTAPAMGDFTLSATRKESTAALGEGAGGSDNSLNIYGVKYAAGAVSASLSLLDWNDSTNAADGRTVVTAAYDLGVAKVGVFYAKQSYTAAGSTDLKNTAIQISAPVGPLSVSLEHGSAKGGTIAAGQTNKGNSLTVSYALSKRTGLTLNTKKYDTGATTTAQESSLLLSHSF